MKHKTLMFSISVIALSLSAKSFKNSRNSNQQEVTLESITTVNNRDYVGVKNASASPHLKKSHGYLSASALLWNVLTDASDVALNTQVSLTDTQETKTNFYQTNNWGWNWGVKATLGFFTSDDWDLSFNFAYLQAVKRYHNALSYSPDETYTYPLSGVLQDLSTNARYDIAGQLPFSSFYQKNNLYFYDGNINLAREFFISKKLSLKPLAGVKGSYFIQKSKIDFDTSDIDGGTFYPGTFSIKNNYWGVGPQVGSGIRFGFTRHVSLNFQLDGALLWGKVLNHEQYDNVVSTDTAKALDCSYKANRYQLVPNVNMLAAFIFDSNFSSDTKNIAFNIGYENRYFFNNVASADATQRQKGSTSFQGATAGLTFSY
jgi:Legionella pneumophila major outer membrane protein precursor